MQVFTFKCPDDLAKQILMEAEKNKVPKSDVVRKALLFYLSQNNLDTKKKSMYDLSKDLCGVLDGPKDLSHNKNYLKGYGQ